MTVTFPQAPLDVRVELGLVAAGTDDDYPAAYPQAYGTGVPGAWTDVTAYAYQRDGTSAPITVTRGRPDENGQAQASACTFELNNRDGRFSPANPAGPFYGKLGRNTPLRVSLPARTPYLRMEDDTASGASCPDAPPLRITGTIDIRLDLRRTDCSASTLAYNWGGNGQTSWYLQGGTAGHARFSWSSDGVSYTTVASTVPMPVHRAVLRVIFAPTAGTVTFYTGAPGSASSAAPTGWTQLGDQVVTGATALFGGTNGLAAGFFYGSLFELAVFSGDGSAGGTLVADADFTAQAAGTESWADAQGNTWSLSGTAAVSDRAYRYHGEMSSLPGKWDTTGRDVSVPVAAGGLLRRLGQGQAPVASPMRRAELLQPAPYTPVQCWPCEDLQGAQLLGSATGGPPMTFQGGTGDGTVTTSGPSLYSDQSFLASDSLPTLNGAALYGQVPSYSGATAWTVRMLLKLGTMPAAGKWSDLLRVSATGKCHAVEVWGYNGGALSLNGYAPDGSFQFQSGPVAFGAAGKNLWVSVEATPVPGGVRYALVTLAPGASAGLAWSTVVATAAGFGNVTAVHVNADGFYTDTVVGHVTVQRAWTSLFSLGQPLNAWQGETAAARFSRLCGENGIACRVIGYPDRSALMGAQGIATLPDLLQECETADQGQLFEPRECLGLGYRTLASLLNQQPAVQADYTQAMFGGTGDTSNSGLEPVYDDQFSVNDMTVTRGGSSVSGANFRYQLDDGSPMSISPPPVGIGDYASSATVNVSTDDHLPDVAGWLVHLGTVAEARWPAVPWNLARPQIAGTDLYWDLLEADIGDYAEAVNLPEIQTYDPVRQLVFQVAESFGGKHYVMTWNTVPESPYEVAVFDDPVYGIADTDGSALAASVTAAATTLLVEATGPSGIRWATTAEGAALPLDMRLGGERVTVTDIAGTGTTQTFTVTRGVNGVAASHAAGESLSLWSAPILSLV